MQPRRQQAAYLETEVDMCGMNLSWQSRRVLMNIVCKQFAPLSEDILVFTVIP